MLSLCLSRACLSKVIIFIYKWRKKTRFLTGVGAHSASKEGRSPYLTAPGRRFTSRYCEKVPHFVSNYLELVQPVLVSCRHNYHLFCVRNSNEHLLCSFRFAHLGDVCETEAGRLDCDTAQRSCLAQGASCSDDGGGGVPCDSDKTPSRWFSFRILSGVS